VGWGVLLSDEASNRPDANGQNEWTKISGLETPMDSGVRASSFWVGSTAAPFPTPLLTRPPRNLTPGTTETPDHAPAGGTLESSPDSAATDKIPEEGRRDLVSLVINGEDHGLQFVLEKDDRIWIVAKALMDLKRSPNVDQSPHASDARKTKKEQSNPSTTQANQANSGAPEPTNVDTGEDRDDAASEQTNSAQDETRSDETRSEADTLTFNGVVFVDPTVRYPGATITHDRARGVVTLTLPANSWAAHKINLNYLPPVVPISSDPSAFLNYAVNVSDQRTVSANLDAGFSLGTAVLRSTWFYASGHSWQRGITNIQYDDPKRMRRWTVGDQFIYSTDGLGGGGNIAGIGVTRAFDLDPYLITLPQPTIAGILQAPGTVDVYRNGILIAQRQVPAGPFNLEGLGVMGGPNDLKVIVHDPFGGTHEMTQSFYAANNNLAKGLSDYAYQVGIDSPAPGQSYSRNRPMLLARQLWGWTDQVTAGYRIEAERGLTNAGLNADLRLPFGGLHLAGARSKSTNTSGWAATAGYGMSGDRWSFSAGGTKMSSGYRRVGDAAADRILDSVGPWIDTQKPFDPVTGLPNPFFDPNNPINTVVQTIEGMRLRRQVYAHASYIPYQHLALRASYTRSTYADGRTDVQQSLGANIDFRGANIFLGWDRGTTYGIKNHSINLTVTIPLGDTGVATYTRTQQRQGPADAVNFQKALNDVSGYGYSFQAQRSGKTTNQSGSFDWQNSIVRTNVQAYNTPFGHSIIGQVSGSVVAIGKEVHLGRPLTEGFALVRVGEGLDNIPVVHENQSVGTTSKHGTFLVTGLLPFQNNQVGFDQDRVPPNYAMSETSRHVSVPRFGGAVVDFHVRPLRSVRGVFIVGDTPLVGGTVTEIRSHKKGETPRSLDAPLGNKGNFYLQDVPQGNYTVSAMFQGRLANCPIMVPATDAPVYNLKTVACSWGKNPSEAVSNNRGRDGSDTSKK
jgi:outer membrane usher protein